MEGGRLTAARVIAAMITTGARSRKELETQLGLGKASISRTVDRLIRGGYVTEGPKADGASRGRKPRSLLVEPDLAYLLGTDLEGFAVRACVLDCARRIVATARRRIGTGWSVGRILKEWSAVLEEVVTRAGIPKSKIAGIGAGLPGVVTSDGLRTYAYLPPGQWVDLDVSEVLGSLGPGVAGANNVLCVADYERRMGVARGQTSFLVVLARYGLGAAMYGNGAFLVGDGAFTCELGHMRIRAGGPACVCGKRGCLDVMASGRTLPARRQRRGRAWKTELGNRIKALGVGVANLLKVFHPSLVILDGVYNDYESDVKPALIEALHHELCGIRLSTPRLAFGDKVEFKTSIGAALRAADAFLQNHVAGNVLVKRRSRRRSATNRARPEQSRSKRFGEEELK